MTFDSIGVVVDPQHVTGTRPPLSSLALLSPCMTMETNFTRGLTRFRCNFVKTQRVFSRAQSTVSKVKPVTASAKVESKPQALLTWPDYLAIRHSKRKWQMVKK